MNVPQNSSLGLISNRISRAAWKPIDEINATNFMPLLSNETKERCVICECGLKLCSDCLFTRQPSIDSEPYFECCKSCWNKRRRPCCDQFDVFPKCICAICNRQSCKKCGIMQKYRQCANLECDNKICLTCCNDRYFNYEYLCVPCIHKLDRQEIFVDYAQYAPGNIKALEAEADFIIHQNDNN
jgi:hypothetical protein